MTPSPLFICGMARSGTSLLLRLLDSHPSLAVLPLEAQVYRQLARRFPNRVLTRVAEVLDWRTLPGLLAIRPLRTLTRGSRTVLARQLRQSLEHLQELNEDAEAALAQLAAHGDTPQRYWRLLLDLLERFVGLDVRTKRYWVEKTPHNERFVPVNERLFGARCRYLHLLRDPRDVIASWLLAKPLVGAARERALINLCVDWSRTVQWCRHNLRTCPGRYHALRYEDLVRDPSEAMGRICRFLDISMHPRLMTPTQLGVPVPANSSYPDVEGPGVIVRSQIARYAEALSPPQITLIERLLGGQMAAYGYAAAADGRFSVGQLPPSVRRHPKFVVKTARVARAQRAYRDTRVPLMGAP